MEPFGRIEWLQRDPDAHHPLFVKRTSWLWFSAELVRIRPAELGYEVKARAAYLALHDFVRSAGETTINGGSRSTLADVRGRLTFVPVGSSVEGWNRFTSRLSSVFAVHLGSPPLDHDAKDIADVPPSLYFKNNSIKATLQKLQSVMEDTGINDPAYAETLGLLLLWELRHAADLKHARRKVRGGLTVRQLTRVKDFIDAQISNDITISDLAGVAGLSQFHFIRAFKDSVGLSPYQFVLSERIHRARELLSENHLSIADVALAVGFHDAAQLNRIFLKIVGVTPTAFRREIGF